MEIVFTYLPVRLKDVTETYLRYSISNLNNQGVIPTIYSDSDYFKNTILKYKWIPFDVDSKYKIDTLWSYPKLKVLSIIDRPFIHLDNDLIIENFNKLITLLDPTKLNLCYKHTTKSVEDFNFIFKKYSNTKLDFDELNNTSIICTENFRLINTSYLEVLDVIDKNYEFFIQRYNGIPPITLNQQYPNLYFKDRNYLFNENPSYENLDLNGICHMAEKNITSRFGIKKLL
jgi:hypothetical protein